MQYSDEEYPSKSIICHNSNKVVDGGDQWTRGYGGVYTYFFEKQREIADNLQISINSVRAHKQRAIQLLRDKLDKKDLLLMIIFEKKLNFL